VPLNKKKKLFIILFSSFVGLALVLQAIGFFYGDKLIGDRVKEIVKEKTFNKYQISFQDLHIKLFSGSISLEKCELKSDSSLIWQNADTARILLKSIKADNIEVSFLRIIKLVRNSELECAKVLVENPEINIWQRKLKKDSVDRIPNYNFKLKPNAALKFISIKNIELKNLSLNIIELDTLTKLRSFNQLSFNIKGFLLDKNQPAKDVIFNASDVDFKIENFNTQIDGSQSNIKFDQLYLSTQFNKIALSNFGLNLKDSLGNELANVAIPEIKINGVNLISIIQKKGFEANFLEINSPFVEIISLKKDTPAINKNRIIEFVQNKLGGLTLDSLSLNNTSLSYFASKLKNQNFSFDKFGLTAEKIAIDSSLIKHPLKYVFCENFRFKINDAEFQTADSAHVLHAKLVNYNSKKENINIDSLNISANISHSNNKLLRQKKVNALYSGSIGSAELVGFKLDEFLFDNAQSLHAVLMSRANIKINTFPWNKVTGENAAKKLDESFKIKSIRFNEISLENSKIEIQVNDPEKPQWLRLTGINASLNELLIDSNMLENGKLFKAKWFEISSQRLAYNLPDQINNLSMENFFISSKSKKLRARKINFKPSYIDGYLKKNPDANPTISEITIAELGLDKFDLQFANFLAKLNVKQLILTEPVINIKKGKSTNEANQKVDFKNLYPTVKNVFSDIKFDTLIIKNGNLSIKNRENQIPQINLSQFDLRARNFHLKDSVQHLKNKLFYCDSIILNTNDLVLDAGDSLHFFKASSVYLGSAKSIFRAKSFGFDTYEKIPSRAQMTRLKKDSWFEVSVPVLELQNFNFLRFYHDNLLKAKLLNAANPNIKVYKYDGINSSADNKFDIRNLATRLPKSISGIEISNVNISNIKLQNQHNINGKWVTNKLENFSIDAQTLVLNHETSMTPFNVLYCDNVNFEIKGFSTPVNDSTQILKTEKINVSTQNRSINVKNLSIEEPSKLKQNKLSNWFTLKSTSVNIGGFDLYNYLVNKRILAASVSLSGNQFSFQKNNDIDQKDKVSFYDKMKESISDITLKKIDIQDLNGKVNVVQKGKAKTFTIPSAEVVFKNFIINQNSVNDKNRIAFSDDVSLKIRKFSQQTENGLYKIVFPEIGVNTQSETLSIDSLQLIPIYGQAEFGQKIGHQKTRFQLSTSKIVLTGFNYPSFINDNKIIAKVADIENVKFSVYRDRNLPIGPPRKPKTLPYILKNLYEYYKIDSIFLDNSSIHFEDKAPNARRTGKLWFEDVNITVSNFTNDKISQMQKATKAIAKTIVMGQSNATIFVDLPMYSPDESYTLNGELNGMPMDAFNNILEPSAFLKVESGMLDKLAFEMEIGQKINTGTVTMFYDDFKISVLRKDAEEDDRKQSSGLKSFIANAFLIKKSNKPDGNFRVGESYYEKPEDKGFVYAWWRTLLSGIKPSIGLKGDKPPEKEK